MFDRDRLRSEMERQGMSQAVLAKAVGVSPASIQQILNGRVRQPRSARIIADILGVSLDWLEGRSEEPSHKFAIDMEEGDLSPVAIPYFTRDFSRDTIEDKNVTVVTRTVLFSKSWIRSVLPNTPYSELIMMRFTSKEMIPTIVPGDDVMIAGMLEYDGDDGSIWMVTYNDKTHTRRIRRTLRDTLELTGDNPLTPSFEVQEAALRYVGKILWQGRLLAP